MTEEKNALRNHASRNMAYLMDKLGVRYSDRGDGLIQACCPMKQHGGDRNNPTALSWRPDISRWICWTHHCEETRGNDVFGFVQGILGINFKDASEWIHARLKEKDINIESVPITPENIYRGTSLHTHEPLKEDALRFLKLDPEYLLGRGFSQEILRSYQVGLWQRPGTYMHDRVVFPIRDHEGFLVGYTGRTIHPESYFVERGIKFRKWTHGRHFNLWPMSGDILISSLLFNLNRSKLTVRESKKMIIVEGPLDGMKLEMAGIHNWVATLGTSFCSNHRTLLVKYGITDLYVAYDNDEERGPGKRKAGEDGLKRLQRIVGDIFNVHKVEIPDAHDCGELSVEQLQTLFKGIGC
jgi:DNA primase